MADRIIALCAGIDPTMRALEYGPSYSPLFPKSKGWNVIIVDHASQADLIEKYEQWIRSRHTAFMNSLSHSASQHRG